MTSAIGVEEGPIGVPDGWTVNPLGTLLREIPKYGINAAAVPYDQSYPTYLRITDISDEGRFNQSNIASVNHPLASKYLLAQGDLVFARTGASVGKSYLHQGIDQDPLVYAGFLIKVSTDTRKLSASYLFHFTHSDSYWRWVKQNSMRSGQPGINSQEYASLPVLLPPLCEQEAIAEALNDTDAYIESLEQLLAKKRDVKQGAMQELLTGKKRLPNFNAEWIPYDFDTVLFRVNAKASQIQSADYEVSGRFPVVDQGHSRIAAYSDRQDRVFECPSGGVIVFGDHTCIVKYVDFNFIIGADGTQILISRGGHSTKFYAYLLQYHGIPTTGYNRHFKLLKERKFMVPDMDEQIAISAVLSDLDAEIVELELKRDKAAAVKLGMMQELLTGRTRLV